MRDFTVANDQLRGQTDEERAQVIQWFSYADSEILPASSAWVFPLLGIMPFNKNVSLACNLYPYILFKRRDLMIFVGSRNEERKIKHGVNQLDLQSLRLLL